MTDIKEYIDSGIVEEYVMGLASPADIAEIEGLAETHPQLRQAINEFSNILEAFGKSNQNTPDPLIKPMLMATLDYTKRMIGGEAPTYPPQLHAHSLVSHFDQWLTRPDMVMPGNFKDFHARIIGYTPQMTTALVWISEMAPQEVHHDEYEKFLIVEGTCDITIGNTVHQLVAGDYLAIPLYENHFVKVTSTIPCKVILQRVAA